MKEVFGPIESYIPHRRPMLVVDEIIDVTEVSIECRATIRPDNIFLKDGVVNPIAMIEFVAQACAILIGIRADKKPSGPRLGFIVGCREVAFSVDEFHIGDVLTVTGLKVHGQENLGGFTGAVIQDGKSVVTVHLTAVDADFVGSSAMAEA